MASKSKRMKKKMQILVPTDFSRASRAGARFAIQWASQQNVHLVFAHVLRIIRLTRWNDKQYDRFAASERTLYTKKLAAFVADLQRRLPLPPGSWSSVLIEGITTHGGLQDYCRQHPGIDLVCMGTQGADKRSRRLFGTMTSSFILQSDTPVIAVPAAYRRKPISQITYASDLADSSRELQHVVSLARPLDAKVGILHLQEAGEVTIDPETLKKIWKRQSGQNIKVEFRRADPSLSIAGNLERTARALHPSLMVLFSNRSRTFFQTLLYPSSAERLSLHTTIPILVLNKRESASGKHDRARPKLNASVR